jgi:hypothetical protein
VIRQRIDQVRLAIEGDSEVAEVTIRWKGGAESRHALRRQVKGYRQLRAFEALIGRMKQLRQGGARAREIAARLQAEGFQTPKGGPWTVGGVRKLLVRYGVVQARRTLPPPERCRRGEWWLADLARELDLSVHGLTNWIKRGWVQARQSSGALKCWLVWADAQELRRLRTLREQRQRPFPEGLTRPRPRPDREAQGGGRGAPRPAKRQPHGSDS